MSSLIINDLILYIKNIKDILIITIDTSGKLYIQGNKGEFKTKQLESFGGNWWKELLQL